MSTKLVDGQKYEVKEISGYGSCLVPVKELSPLGQLLKLCQDSYPFGSDLVSSINKNFRLSTRNCNTTLQAVCIMDRQDDSPTKIGLLWRGYTGKENDYRLVNWISFGLHTTKESFMKALKDLDVQVTLNSDAKK